MAEWLKYIALRNVEDSQVNRDLIRLLRGHLRQFAMSRYENRVAGWFDGAIPEREPSAEELIATSDAVLPARCGSEAVLSLGAGLRQMRNPHYAGVISVMPHGCMPGGIVAAMAEQISRQHDNKPWISLTFDGFADKVNPERVADLAEQVRHTRRHART